MIFSLDVRRARKGDCLLLHFGSEELPGLAIVDGGPRDVYLPELKPRLLQIRKARTLHEGEPLPVDLLMVSHMDDDHIQGILDLTREMIDGDVAPLRVLSFWHNSFDDIIGNRPDELTAAVRAGFGEASLAGGLPADATLDPVNGAAAQSEDTLVSGLKVLASISQGHRLRADARRLEFPLNPEFDEKLILARRKPAQVADGLAFVVAGPMQAEVEKLQQKHDEWLEDQQARKKTGAAALAAYVDESVTNLSSIVVLARFGGKRMLLTGDARGDKIIQGMEKVGLLKPGGRMRVDVLKVPHHGSANNVDLDFFDRIHARHYVFSGNGEHGNPEREAIEMLFKARGGQALDVHLTYPVDEIDLERKKDWRTQQARERQRKQSGLSNKDPRPDWSPAEHSLAAFFKHTKLAKNQKIHVVEENKPHVIDLLDPLGY
jgi:hypothetical protein